MQKTCKTCQVLKDEAEFHVGPHGKGRRAHCKPCISAQRKAEYRSGTGARSRDSVYEQVLVQKYGMTLAEYNALLHRQAYRCAICRQAQRTKIRKDGTEVRRLEVDHDHVTGATRGLLCHRCNLLVWAIEDNHTTLDAIRRYVEEFRASFRNGAPL